MIILDTNVISEPLRPTPNSTVTGWLDAQDIATLHLSTVTLAEVRYGIAALPEGRRRHRLHERFENEVLPLFTDRRLPFGEPDSAACAELRAAARSRGAPLGDLDALIAGTARAHGYAVATRDTAPFESAGLSVINPFEDLA